MTELAPPDKETMVKVAVADLDGRFPGVATGQLLGFLSMVDRRKRTHRDIAEQLARDDRRILRSAIPATVAIEASPARGVPFVLTNRSSGAAIAYRDLWNEIQTRAHGQVIADAH